MKAFTPGYQPPTELASTKFNSGQDIQPYFEGWIRNKDGSFDLVFGYFNRNWKEELAIPAGAENAIEPGGPDRGQPTYFLPRRQSWIYRVRVPSDFGKGVVAWTVTANGKTQKAYGELMPVEEITERIVMTRGNLNPGDDDPNKPPTISIAPIAAAATNTPIPLVASVADDGLPKPRVPAPARTAPASGDATTIQAQANSSTSETASRTDRQLDAAARTGQSSGGANRCDSRLPTEKLKRRRNSPIRHVRAARDRERRRAVDARRRHDRRRRRSVHQRPLNRTASLAESRPATPVPPTPSPVPSNQAHRLLRLARRSA